MTHENHKEFVELVTKARLNEAQKQLDWIKEGFEPKSQDSDTESNQSAKSHRSSSDKTKGKPQGKGSFDEGKSKGKHKGKGRDTPSLTLQGLFAESLVPRIRLEYCFLTENEIGRNEATEGDGVVDMSAHWSCGFRIMRQG